MPAVKVWCLDVVPSPCSLLGIVTFLQVSLSKAVSQVKQNNFPFQTLPNLHNKGNIFTSQHYLGKKEAQRALLGMSSSYKAAPKLKELDL